MPELGPAIIDADPHMDDGRRPIARGDAMGEGTATAAATAYTVVA